MKTNMDHKAAGELLVSIANPVLTQQVRLEDAAGRILAQLLIAADNVPSFDRSPYDGYAFRASDTKGASREHPVTLKILEEIPAGSVPSMEVVPGTATKILTGAPIPKGADAVIMYEKTDFDPESVTIYEEAHPGDNIIYAGEDVKKGSVLARAGSVIDAGLSGTLASQRVFCPVVYRKPVVGIISTGSELVDNVRKNFISDFSGGKGRDAADCDEKDGRISENGPDVPPGKIIVSNRMPENSPDIPPGKIIASNRMSENSLDVPLGKIINSNRYTLAAALRKDGCIPVYLGTVGDDVRQIADLILSGLGSEPAGSAEENQDLATSGGCNVSANPPSSEQSGSSLLGNCDMILLTGGVSAGDYDLTPEAMELAGCELLVKGVMLKPGMACCYGVRDGKLVCGLSGNPASSLTNYYAVVRPAVRKLTGLSDYMPQMFTVALAEDFKKKSKIPRILKGRLEISEQGTALLHIPKGQGNTMISSSVGCDCMALVTAGSGPIAAGTKLQGFLV